MGGLNLEVAKFGMYLMFPIGVMYYFGTNLDNRFSVPGFWPSAENSNRLPRDREELQVEYEKLVARQRAKQARKIELDKQQGNDGGE